MNDSLADLMFRLNDVPEDESVRDRSRTESCPSFGRFAIAIRRGWTAEELEHARDCDWCQTTAALFWREACPAPLEISAFAAQSERSPFRRALERHLAEGCRRCPILAQHLRLHRATRPSGSGISPIAADWVALPDPSPALAAAAGPKERFFCERRFSDPLLHLKLAEVERELVVTLESPDRALQGARFQLEILGVGQPVNVELVLDESGSQGVAGRRSLGPFVRLLETVCGDCALVLQRIDSAGAQ